MKRKSILSIIAIIVLTLCCVFIIGCGNTDNGNSSVEITLSCDLLELEVGDEVNLTVTVTPNATVTLSSSNTSVATIDDDGNVTAIGMGAAIITACVGDKTATCLVVVNKPTTELNLDKTDLVMALGSKSALKAIDSLGAKVFWSSSNSSVASVDDDGNVSANKVGAVIITASTEEHKATCLVVVTKHATEVAIDTSELEMIVGEICTLDIAVLPEDTTDAVVWGSTNPSVVVVKDGKLYAYANGEAIITVMVGDICKVCNVRVISSVAVETLALDKYSVQLAVGDESTLVPTVRPSSAIEDMVWGSSDSMVVKVVNGKITALSSGTAYVFASVGGISVKCVVIVSEGGQSIVLPMSVAVGGYEYAVEHTIKFTATDSWGHHFGIDFIGSGDVYAINDGKVIAVETSTFDGTTVTIKHSGGLVSIYKSISDVTVEVGDTVNAGDKIGVSAANTLQESDLGAHLHFELKLNGEYIDPATVLPLPKS